MMVPCDESGEWNFTMIMCFRNENGFWNYGDFASRIQSLMNEGYELHGSPFVHEDELIQPMMKFVYPEYETGDDDDGLPLPEAGNEPIEQVRNCS